MSNLDLKKSHQHGEYMAVALPLYHIFFIYGNDAWHENGLCTFIDS